jgi:hypothetical protein
VACKSRAITVTKQPERDGSQGRSIIPRREPCCSNWQKDYEEIAADLERGAVKLEHPELMPQQDSLGKTG